MQTFRSNHCPQKDTKWVVNQRFAMKHYSWLAVVVLSGTMYKLYRHEGFLWFSAIGMIVALVFGNVFATWDMRAKWGELEFNGNSFTLQSVDSVINNKQEKRYFPLMYANPVYQNNSLQIHYHDSVLILKRTEWSDYEQICNLFQQENNS